MVKTRVLFLNSSVSGGGAGRALVTLLKGIDPTRIESHVVLPFDGIVGQAFRDAGAAVHYHPLLPERFSKTYLKLPSFLKVPWIERLVNIALFPKLIWDLRQLVYGEGIHLIYANHLIQTPIAVGLGRLTGRPVVLHSREVLGHPVSAGYFSWVANSAHVKKVISVSRVSGKSYERTGKVEVVYDAIDAERYGRGVEPKLRTEFRVPKDRKIVGFMGRIVERKGVPDLIRAFAEVLRTEPDALLAIVGGNDPGLHVDLLKNYRDLARELGVEEKTIFTGFRADVRGYAADFDLFVLPSTDPEPFGLVCFEAMALRIPTVIGSHSGIAEMIRDGHDGLLFEPRSISSMAGCMTRLLRDEELRRTIARNGYETAVHRFATPEAGRKLTRAILEAVT